MNINPTTTAQLTTGGPPVTSPGVIGALLTTKGATLYSVLESNGDFRVYVGPQGDPTDVLIARGSLLDHQII